MPRFVVLEYLLGPPGSRVVAPLIEDRSRLRILRTADGAGVRGSPEDRGQRLDAEQQACEDSPPRAKIRHAEQDRQPRGDREAKPGTLEEPAPAPCSPDHPVGPT